MKTQTFNPGDRATITTNTRRLPRNLAQYAGQSGTVETVGLISVAVSFGGKAVSFNNRMVK